MPAENERYTTDINPYLSLYQHPISVVQNTMAKRVGVKTSTLLYYLHLPKQKSYAI
jgi:hypothetical protein